MPLTPPSQLLAHVAPELERILSRAPNSQFADVEPLRFDVADISCETLWIAMRDGIQLATDLYLPPTARAPAIVMRTPYGRSADRLVGTFLSFVRRGYAVISQDCRGTGDSEPNGWDYYVYEREDGIDLVEWIRRQKWFDGFLAGCGGSYVGQTQWCMATHPGMSAIVPEVSGLGIAPRTARLHMFVEAYSRTVGKGTNKVRRHYTELERALRDETLAGGYFNDPLHRPLPQTLLALCPRLRDLAPLEAIRELWLHYCSLGGAQRAALIKAALGTDVVSMREIESLQAVFGCHIAHDAHALPYASAVELAESVHAPALIVTGWYDWGLDDALATWALIARAGQTRVRDGSRLLITPAAHNSPGYHECDDLRPELQHNHRLENHGGLLLRWYDAIRNASIESWPAVIYYLMGANEWRAAPAWPPPGARQLALYLGAGGSLRDLPPQQDSDPDRYIYDPDDPTPTVGGSIVSAVYPAGSVDVSTVQRRSDLLVYTTEVLERDLDIVGPIRLILYARSTARDTDFVARVSDVFPDGRAVQLQTGLLRARYRNLDEEPELLAPARIYRLEIDLAATANRFEAGHRVRLDISSADFPKFDRNANRGGDPGPPVAAEQEIHHSRQYASCLLLSAFQT